MLSICLFVKSIFGYFCIFILIFINQHPHHHYPPTPHHIPIYLTPMILCRPARHEVRLPPCGQEAESCFKDNSDPKFRETDSSYKGKVGSRNLRPCYFDNPGSKSRDDSETYFSDGATMSDSYRHRPKGNDQNFNSFILINQTKLI